LEPRVVRFERALVRGELKDTKTEQVRAMDLIDRAWAILVRSHEACGRPKRFSPIFSDPKTGRGWSDGAAQRNLYLNKAMAALGSSGHVAYNARHTYASLALSGSVNVAYLARQLGHSNAGMLLKHYGRWIEDGEAVRQSKSWPKCLASPQDETSQVTAIGQFRERSVLRSQIWPRKMPAIRNLEE
jgi:integrase